jgi:hypothetical protein
MTDDHPYPDRELAAERYLLGEMSDVDREQYEQHFFSCEECADEVRTTATFLDDARAMLVPDAVGRAGVTALARPAAAAAWRRSTAIPWAIAASLLVFTAYQSLVLIPGLQSQLTPRELDPITIRPDSRGQEAVVAPGDPSDGFTLALEINDVQEGAALEYKITTDAGRVVASRRCRAPRAGRPLLVWLSASTLAEPTRYVLVVQDVATGRSLGAYRFARSQ